MCTVLNSLKSSPGPGLARTEIVLRFGLWIGQQYIIRMLEQEQRRHAFSTNVSLQEFCLNLTYRLHFAVHTVHIGPRLQKLIGSASGASSRRISADLSPRKCGYGSIANPSSGQLCIFQGKGKDGVGGGGKMYCKARLAQFHRR
jgi:hypothetical protein